MPWSDYADAQLRGIEETARASEDLWAKALAVLVAYETLLRDRVRRRLLVLPITADEHWDFSRRMPFARFRVGLRADVSEFVRGTSYALTGVAPSGGGIPPANLDIPRTGVASDAMRAALERADRALERAARILARDRARARQRAARDRGEDPPPLDDLLPDRGGPSTPSVSPTAPDDAAPPDVSLVDRPARARDEDAADAITDLLMNVWGNAGNEARHFAEQMLGLVTRLGTRPKALDHLDAERPDGPPGSRGWRTNRNIMRKSVVEHVRAMHRRRIVAGAVADGHTHFRLDVPKDRFGRVAPDGALGRQLWKVRTLSEWEAVQALENNGRNASSDFAGLGFGFGDMSYVVAVPREYLADAAQQGAAWRAQHMGARVR